MNQTVSADYFNMALQRLIDKCEQAHFVLSQNGTLPDLSGMDNEVDKICSDIQASEPSVAHATEEKMAQLIKSLEKLTDALNNYKAKFASGT